ncbi:MAG: hypothetical protein HYY03_05865 [Chloroflexi bacterium]|nr:hypothetical protein [Chloroflexota bacterium]
MATALAIAGCSGGREPSASTSAAALPTTGSLSPAATRASTAPSTPTASPTPTAAPTASPGLTLSEADLELALQAALRDLDAATDPECRALQKLCVSPHPPNSGARGIALFNVFYPQGGGSLLVMGKDALGEWHYWFTTQHALTPPIYLPGDMRVCSGGPGLNARSEADVNAQKIETLADETIVRGEEFVLTEPGTQFALLEEGFGNGWYRISSPVEGWVYSPYVYYPEVSEGCQGLPLTW